MNIVLNIIWPMVLGVIILLPIISMAYLWEQIDSCHIILKKKHCLHKKPPIITRKNFLFPSKIQSELEATHRYNPNSVQEIMTAYKKMIWAFWWHVTLGVLYLAIWILWLAINWHNLTTQAQILFFTVLCVLVLYMFWISPAAEFCRQENASKHKSQDLIQMMLTAAGDGPVNWLTRKNKYGILFISALLITLVTQLLYLKIALVLGDKMHCQSENPAVNYLITLIILLIYQYPIQKKLACFFVKILKSPKHAKHFGKFTQGDLLYTLLKNTTYVTYVLVTISEQGSGTTASVIGSLFLIDTFFDKRDDLLKKLQDEDENTSH